MRPLWVSVIAGGGRSRPALVTASTAVVSGLLLVAVSYARLGGYSYGYDHRDAMLLGPIADPGTRGGAILAVVLATVPVALLLDQCVRLGVAAQRRRYQALAIAGATRRDLRRWGAVETGVPAVLGALSGVLVWLLLRLVLGTWQAEAGRGTLVPTATDPGWWAVLVVALVAAYGVLIGRRAAVRATVDVRREPRAPAPWGLGVVGLAIVLLAVGLRSSAGALLYGGVLLAVLGVMTSTPWLAYAVSGRITRRTADPAMLLASRRIRADHGAAGRAAAAVGAVGLTLGVLGVFVADLLTANSVQDLAYYLVPSVLVGVLALLAVGVIALSLSLHSIEATLGRRREMSALVATGVPVRTLEAATRAECRLVTLPVTVVAACLGAAATQLTLAETGTALLGGVAALVLAAGAVLLAVRLSTRVVRPWLREAVSVGNLRTE
jgi:hypothetical protein